ncbi:hypothetical protein HY411_01535, partial [Candidatus Gottesmanbacteria bacterium]|nr:hypothetical protein [Candidatus Gottesmanbacteria bacterium]
MKRIVEYILISGSLVLLGIFLWWHYQLGQTRYFDVDEFAHLSWTYQMLSGRKPYLDFLFFFPPGFHVFLSPLFVLGGGVTPILAGRMMAFIVFVLLVGATMLLFWLMRRSWVAILAGVFLSFLPLPFDKFLEIRPDSLATLFAMGGMVFQILGMQDLALKGLTFLGKKVNPYQFLAGFFYALSLLILPKVLPQVGVAVAVEVLRWFMQKRKTPALLHLVFGLSAPLFLFGLWALTLGNLDQVIYSLTNLPVEANKISQTFIMLPDLFFYPNTIFYGQSGWSTGLLVNHAIWIIAIFVAAYRLVAPFLTGSKETAWSELLIAATFFTHVFFYVQIVPLKHTQYLIPIAVFVAFYAADAVDMLWRKTRDALNGVFLTMFFLGSVGLWRVFVAVNSPKLIWTNTDTIKQLTAIFESIPTSEYILDLTGQTIYYRHPYKACCIPFGQAAPFLTRPLPSLSTALENSQTKYVFEGGLKRTNTLLPQDQAYISVHY